MTSDDRLRCAGVALGASVLIAAVLRAWVWFSSGLLFGPALGGVTALILARLPGRADALLPASGLAEVIVTIAMTVAATTSAVGLLKGRPVAPRRWAALTWSLVALGALHVASVLAVLPTSGLHPATAEVVAFATISLADIGLVLYARTVTMSPVVSL